MTPRYNSCKRCGCDRVEPVFVPPYASARCSNCGKMSRPLLRDEHTAPQHVVDQWNEENPRTSIFGLVVCLAGFAALFTWMATR